MKQKNSTIWKAFLSGGAAMLLLAGCVKESAINEKYRPAGTPITFSAATGYENGNGTRTEYSGELYGENPKYERIDWVENDLVTIVYSHGGTTTTSNYVVTDVSGTEDKNSYASVEVAEGQPKLTWGEGEGDHTFYAMYPSNGFGDNTSASLTNNRVQGSIPAVQTLHVKDGKYLPPMEYGYMVAYKQITSGSTESRVTLPFTPVVTAFEFKLQKRSGDTGARKVTGAELMQWDTGRELTLAGTFAFNIMGGDENGAIWGNTGSNGRGKDDSGSGTGMTFSFLEDGISVTFPEGGVSLPAYDSGTYLDFTIFALPVDQTKLILKLIFDDDSSETLHLNDSNGSPHTFAAGKKHVITNRMVPALDFEYVLEHTGTIITLDDGTVVQEVIRNKGTAGATNTAPFNSYRNEVGSTTTSPVPVVFDYAEADDNGLPVRDPVSGEIVWSSTRPEGLSGVSSPVANPGSGTFSARVGEYSPGVVKETVNEFLMHAENLQSRPSVGSSTAPYDLSMHDIHGVERNNRPVTANCYIVDRAGWYMFPIVYGNAIDYTKESASGMAGTLYNNGVNAYAYKDAITPEDNPDVTHTNSSDWIYHNFENFTETSLISTPYVLDDAGSLPSTDVEAVVVWQDVENATYSFIENVAVEDIASSNIFFDPKNSSYKSTVPYIKFQVPEGTIDPDETKEPLERVTGIRQGNAVIAVRLKNAKTIGGTTYDPGTILWSWHIWITDGYDTNGDLKGDGLAPIPVTTHENYGGYTSNIMPVTLGWCDGSTDYYKDRIWYARAKHSYGSSATPIIFRVVQKKAPAKFMFSGTYYQYGRKDPFIPAAGYYKSFVNKAVYSPEGYLLTDGDLDPQTRRENIPFSAPWCIRYPYIAHITGIPCVPTNMWTMSNIHYGPVSKTVYDPCPPGYCIARKGAFMGFTPQGTYVDLGWLDEYDDVVLDINAEDRTGDGIITGGDFFFEAGWYFYTNTSKDKTLFFPATPRRQSGKIGNEGGYHCIWTGSTVDNMNGSMFCYSEARVRILIQGTDNLYEIRASEEE